jgi:hypothetical protein
MTIWGFTGLRQCGRNVDVPETTKPLHFCRGFVLYGAGTRRTVAFGAARFSAGLEFGGKFGVPQLVTINKSASYGTQWNRTGASLTSSNLFKLSLA